MVGAQAAQLRQFVFARGRRVDDAPGHLGDLHARRPHAAGRAQDQHVLRRADAAPAEQHPPGRPVGDRQRRGLVERRAVGQRDEVRRGHERVLRQPAGGVLADGAVLERGIDQHPLPHRDPLHAGADLGHHPRDVAAADERQRGLLPRHAAPDEDVEMVERAGVDLHHRLAGAGARGRNVRFQPQRIAAAVFADDNGAHLPRPAPVSWGPAYHGCRRPQNSARSPRGRWRAPGRWQPTTGPEGRGRR